MAEGRVPENAVVIGQVKKIEMAREKGVKQRNVVENGQEIERFSCISFMFILN